MTNFEAMLISSNLSAQFMNETEWWRDEESRNLFTLCFPFQTSNLIVFLLRCGLKIDWGKNSNVQFVIRVHVLLFSIQKKPLTRFQKQIKSHKNWRLISSQNVNMAKAWDYWHTASSHHYRFHQKNDCRQKSQCNKN